MWTRRYFHLTLFSAILFTFSYEFHHYQFSATWQILGIQNLQHSLSRALLFRCSYDPIIMSNLCLSILKYYLSRKFLVFLYLSDPALCPLESRYVFHYLIVSAHVLHKASSSSSCPSQRVGTILTPAENCAWDKTTRWNILYEDSQDPGLTCRLCPVDYAHPQRAHTSACLPCLTEL